MDHENPNLNTRLTGWLKDVAAIDPAFAKDEYWDTDFVDIVVPDGPVHELVHKMRDLTMLLGPRAVESCICTALVLGYLMGQKSVEKAN